MDIPKVIIENGRFRKRVDFPTELTPELAEEIGIHIGDGSLMYRRKSGHYDYYVCLGAHERTYVEHVVSLMKKVFNVMPSHIDIDADDNSISIEYMSKLLVLWKKSIGLPVGKKKTILIPDFVLKSPFAIDCIRGIFDTDGSVTFKKKTYRNHCYPVLKIDSSNPNLIRQISAVLKLHNIDNSCLFDFFSKASNGTICHTSTVFISGRNNIDRWFEVVRPSNEVHLSKYKLWTAFGFCPPGTSLEQRKTILEGIEKIRNGCWCGDLNSGASANHLPFIIQPLMRAIALEHGRQSS
jgi:hypothetical protein